LKPVRCLSFIGILPLALGITTSPPPPARVAVLAIALNNLANQPTNPDLPARLRLLGEALRGHLGGGCGYELVQVDSAAEASAEIGAGYLYAHPDVAVRLLTSNSACARLHDK
jgi:hypothetical protein